MTTRLHRAAVCLAVPAVLLVGACGKSDTPAASPTASSTATSEQTAQSPAPTTAETTDGAATGGKHTDQASFVSAMKAGMSNVSSAHVSMQLEGQGQKVSMDGVTKVDAKDPAMKMTMSMGGMDIDLIVLGGKVYVKGIPGAAAEGKWAQFDKNSPVAKSMLESASGADPTRMFDEFEKALTDVRYVGPETVDGEQLQKYAVKLDTTKVQTGDAASLPKTIDYDVWLDSKDRMRKVTFDLSGVKADMRMDKYGEPLDIKAPPASQVVKGQG
jgi:hypothetical protein